MSLKILYRGIFIATFKRTYIQDQARPIIVTSLLSYETSPYFSWREKSLLPKFLSQLEPGRQNLPTSSKCHKNPKMWHFCYKAPQSYKFLKDLNTENKIND